MLVAVTGSTGLIGTALVRRLTGEGHQVLRLVRSRPQGPQQAHWDPAAGRIDAGALAGADAVVHLAGKGIGDNLRWTRRVKREILDSRVQGTRLLATTLAGLGGGPRVLVCASGIHYYGDHGDELLTEQSASGQGFLAEVCRRWEAAADPARAAGIRVVHLRTALVQAADGFRDAGGDSQKLPQFPRSAEQSGKRLADSAFRGSTRWTLVPRCGCQPHSALASSRLLFPCPWPGSVPRPCRPVCSAAAINRDMLS